MIYPVYLTEIGVLTWLMFFAIFMRSGILTAEQEIVVNFPATEPKLMQKYTYKLLLTGNFPQILKLVQYKLFP